MRFYIVPVIGTGFNGDQRRPKYFADDACRPLIADATGAQFMDYGDEPVMLVCANTSPIEHAGIVANADVLAAPVDLTQMIGADLFSVSVKLEAINIPADGITVDMSYRTLLRWITKLFSLHHRFQGLGGGRFFPVGISADSRISDLSVVHQQKLVAVARHFRLKTQDITPNASVRIVIKNLADQLPGWSMAGML